MMIALNETSDKPGFPYDGATMLALRQAISAERFETYLKLARGDKRKAFHLYTYNIALGSAFYGPLQALEISLRNAASEGLTANFGTRWFESSVLDVKQRNSVTDAKAKLKLECVKTTPGQLVASLTLGFWVALFAKRYEVTLWRPALHQCFDPTPSRRRLYDQLNRMRTLRNRIAHHRLILSRDLLSDYKTIKWALNMLSPATAAWVEHHSRVPEELKRSSHINGRF